MKLVYKLCTWGNNCEIGVVIKETEKQYKVNTVNTFHDIKIGC